MNSKMVPLSSTFYFSVWLCLIGLSLGSQTRSRMRALNLEQEITMQITDHRNENEWRRCSDVTPGLDIACTCRKNIENGTDINCDTVVFQGDFPLLPFRYKIHSFRQRNSGLQSLASQLFTASDIPLKRLDVSYNGLRRPTERMLEGVEDTLEELRMSNNWLGDQLNPLFFSSELNRLRNLKLLDLSVNEIKGLDDNAFKNCDKLEELSLGGNSLSKIPSGALRSLLNLKRLYLQNNQITSVVKDSFPTPLALQTLNLSRNFITSIDNRSFNKLTQLRSLYLGFNKLSGLVDDAFGGLERLEELDISDNFFTSLPVAAIRSLSNLKNLDLHANLLESIDGLQMLNLSSLENLDLSRNSIPDLGNRTLSGFEKLKSLNLAVNSLRKIEKEAFVGLDSLESLNLEDNNIFSVPTQALENLRSLRSLSLAFNRIGVISSEVFKGLMKLNELNLSYNLIREIPENTFQSMTNLRILNLRGNQLTTPTGAFSPLANSLLFLDLSYNKLNELPRLNLNIIDSLYLEFNNITQIKREDFKTFSSVMLLNLSGNAIDKVELDSFTDLKMIEAVDLSTNMLQAIPAGLFDGMSNMKNIFLQNNFLRTVPSQAFRNMPLLDTINLSNNEIRELQPLALRNLPNLKVLNLENNKISRIDVTTLINDSGTSGLKKLVAKNNKLSEISAVFLKAVPMLEVLDLSENSIEVLPGEFFKLLRSLSYLNLSKNRLTYTGELQFARMLHLRHLDLSYNKLRSVNETSFQNSSQLQFLNLGYNAIQEMPSAMFQGIVRLNLNLEGNRIAALPGNIFERSRIQRLQSLNLASNWLENVPVEALQKQYFFLESVNFAKNKIKEIPSNVDILVNLKTLDLSFNPLTSESIENIFTEPKTVRDLNLAGVGISRIQTLETPFLRRLNLSNNILERIGDSVFQKTVNLEALDLTKNKIMNLNTGLSGSWPKLHHLKELYLSKNPIQYIIKGDFNYLKSLRTLHMANLQQMIRFESNAFEDLPLLQELWIYRYPRLETLDSKAILQKFNTLEKLKIEITESTLGDQLLPAFLPRLEDVEIHGRGGLKAISPGALAGISSPRLRFALRDTAIVTLPSSLLFPVPMSSHIVFDLSGAKLTSLSPQMLSVVENRSSFMQFKGLPENPVYCDCNIRALRRWILNRLRHELAREEFAAIEQKNLEALHDRSRLNNKRLDVRAVREAPNEPPKVVPSEPSTSSPSIITLRSEFRQGRSRSAPREPRQFPTYETRDIVVKSVLGSLNPARGFEPDSIADARIVDDDIQEFQNDLKELRCSGPSQFEEKRLVDIEEHDLMCDGEGKGEVITPTAEESDELEDMVEAIIKTKPRPFVPAIKSEEPDIIWLDNNELGPLETKKTKENLTEDPRKTVEANRALSSTGNNQQAENGLNTVDTLIIGIVGGVVAFVAILIIVICLVRFKANKPYRAGPLAGSLALRYKEKCTCIAHNGPTPCVPYVAPVAPIYGVPMQPALSYASRAPSRATLRSSKMPGSGSVLSVGPPPSTVSRASYYAPSPYYVTYPMTDDEMSHR